MRFIGSIEAKIDAKGRVFLPSAFRKALQQAGEENLVMRKDVHQTCLVIYPESVWNKQMDLMRAHLSRYNSKHQLIFRQFVSDVEFVTLDGNGRFLISKHYQKIANLQQRVKFIGMGDTIEIWNGEVAEEPFMDPDEFSKAFEQAMADKDIND